MLSRDKERQVLNRICLLWTKTKEPEITFFVSSQRANQIIGSQKCSNIIYENVYTRTNILSQITLLKIRGIQKLKLAHLSPYLSSKAEGRAPPLINNRKEHSSEILIL